MKTLIEKLKEKGHSAITATQIALDVQRGNAYAIKWAKTLGIDIGDASA